MERQEGENVRFVEDEAEDEDDGLGRAFEDLFELFPFLSTLGEAPVLAAGFAMLAFPATGFSVLLSSPEEEDSTRVLALMSVSSDTSWGRRVWPVRELRFL